MTRIEIIERFVRIAAVVSALVLGWLCLGGESWFAVNTPISGFLVHLVMFFFMAAVACVGWADSASRIIFGAFVLALVLEVVQLVLPGRTFSVFALAGNLAGVGLAWIFFRVLLNFKRTIRA